MNILLAAMVVIIGNFIGAFGGLFLKKGSAKFSLNPFEIIKNYYIISGIFCYAIAAIMFIIALKGNPLSILYPLVSTQYIWVAFFSVSFLDEKMNSMKWMGIIAIILGIVCIGIGS
tara:strand:- start:7485 stop:7832 length:348 start_codon:yes stop_codon:yes gene_type:complete